jgi:hypothetical protein
MFLLDTDVVSDLRKGAVSQDPASAPDAQGAAAWTSYGFARAAR